MAAKTFTQQARNLLIQLGFLLVVGVLLGMWLGKMGA